MALTFTYIRIRVVSGKRHAGEIAGVALELLDGIKVFQIPNMPEEKFRLRIGLHTGKSASLRQCRSRVACVVWSFVTVKCQPDVSCLHGNPVSAATSVLCQWLAIYPGHANFHFPRSYFPSLSCHYKYCFIVFPLFSCASNFVPYCHHLLFNVLYLKLHVVALLFQYTMTF